jgi:diguanylate cyclase (GGDEF)-like protein
MFHGSEINLEVGHAVSISISCGTTAALAVRFVRSLPRFDIMSRESAIARLLIVDDDLLVRTLAVESLKAAGFDVSEADNGISGLAQIEQCRPDLILLDVMMPEMDGCEVCRTLRSRPGMERIPLIMLTGLDDTTSIEAAYESGATHFIAKPINATLLDHRVRYELRAARMVDVIDQHRGRLANAQRIARLGSWTWQPNSAKFECSTEYLDVIGGQALSPDHQWRDVLRYVHPDDVDFVAEAVNLAIAQGHPYSMAFRILRNDGVVRTVYEQIEVFRDHAGLVKRIEGTIQDITERVEAEDRIRQLADYDPLTGLAKRKLFSEIMQHGLNRSRPLKANAAVLDIHIDRFKRINETLGHAAADQLLKEIAHRMVECVRASDLASTTQDVHGAGVTARMSGDGFAIFLAEIKRADDAAVIARRLAAAIFQPLQCCEHALALTASIGIAVFPDNGDEVGMLLKNAEAALREAKLRNTGTRCFFTHEMNTHALSKLDTENDLRAAIDRDELMLFYQPRVDVTTGRIAGAEALVRWQHPRRGLVAPNKFISIAEESGLIIPLTAWVVRAACRQLGQWKSAGLMVLPVSINFSAHSFCEDGLGDVISSALREFGVAPSVIEGEITESMLMEDVERAVSRRHALRALGVEMAMDDFGTGYSSLAYLKRFPLNVLKIDRSFVKDVLTDGHDAAIAATIITLGKAMGLEVVAVGMELVEQANFLLARGWRLMQGFLFSRPLPADAFTEVLRSGIKMPPGLRVEASRAGVDQKSPAILWAVAGGRRVSLVASI